jgi:TolB-like protein/Flp pilus assembly protein TadD
MPVENGDRLSHYRLLDMIGRGGMGVVWRAEDTILRRIVALKVLPPEAALDGERRRMLIQEARLASSLNDPHIAQVFELGNDGGLDFIVMEYIEGTPLTRIMDGRPLPPAQVAKLGFQVARAISQAHHKKLLHRDLKPGNILVKDDGDAKVVDFGLARLFEMRDTELASQLNPLSDTRPLNRWAFPDAKNEIAGTLPYMAPEQVRGGKLDPRSDVFSLGAVLYEMLTGRRPFQADRSQLVQEIVERNPPPPHSFVENVPMELERIVEKTLAKNPGDRYQTMDDLAVDLKRLSRDLEAGRSLSYRDMLQDVGNRRTRWVRAGLVLGVVILFSLVIVRFMSRHDVRSQVLARTVLVFPMQVRGQADGAEYLGQAFAEAIAVNLVRSKQVNVLPVPGQMELQGGTEVGLKNVAKAQGAGRMVTGAFDRDEQGLHVTLNLLDSETRHILWASQTDVQQGELPRLAVTVAKDIAGLLGAPMTTEYEYFRYVTGSPVMANSPFLPEAIGMTRRHNVPEALEATRRLVAEFPNEPDAHVLRIVALQDALNNVPDPANLQAFHAGIDALARVDPRHPLVDVLRAQQLSNDRGEHTDAISMLTQVLAREDLSPSFRAHAARTRGRILARTKNMTGAFQDLEEALRLDPANAFTYSYFGSSLTAAGRHEAAVERGRQAVALEPSASTYGFLALSLMAVGKLEEALAHAMTARRIDGQAHNLYVLRVLATILSRLDRHDESLAVYHQMCDIHEDAGSLYGKATELAYLRRTSEARQAAYRADSLRVADGDEPSFARACYLGVVGDRTAAIVELEQLVAQIGLDGLSLEDPDLTSLHGEPRFEAVRNKVVAQMAELH